MTEDPKRKAVKFNQIFSETEPKLMETLSDNHLRNHIFAMREVCIGLGAVPRDQPTFRSLLRLAAERNLPAGKAPGYLSMDEIHELAMNPKVSAQNLADLLVEAFGHPLLLDGPDGD